MVTKGLIITMPREILTEENFQSLETVMEKNKSKKGRLMLVLHESQDIFGCVPFEVQKKISESFNIPLAEIYGVVTFYSRFTLEPKGDYTIGVCMGTACYVKGSQKIIDKVKNEVNVEVGHTSEDGKYSLEATRCLGACGLAPVLTVNHDVHGRLTAKEISKILAKY